MRDEAFRIAAKSGCNIVIEKIGKSVESIAQIKRENPDYEVNLRLVHCCPAVSRIRNALRFQKYNRTEENKVARMVSDDFIKSISDSPLETFYTIVNNQELRSMFSVCEAFIQEYLFEVGKHTELVALYDENMNLQARMNLVDKYLIYKLSDRIDCEKIKDEILCDIYSTTSSDNTKRLLDVENGEFEILDKIVEQYSLKNKKWED